jgi:LAO/AO transport system kinase
VEIEVMLGILAGNAFKHVRAHHGGSARLDGTVEEGAAAAWTQPVLGTAASRGEGIAELAGALDRHFDWLETAGVLVERRRRRLLDRAREVVDRMLRQWLWQESGVDQQLRDRLDDLAAGRVSPYEVAADVLEGLKQGARS